MRALFLMLALLAGLVAQERELAQFPDGPRSGGVSLRVAVAGEGPQAELVVTFTPSPGPGGEAMHLYSQDLPRKGLAGVGRPTLLEIAPGQAARALGPQRVDPPLPIKTIDDLPVYPDGPVTLRLPLALPPGDGSPVETVIQVTYMACAEFFCNRPIEARELRVPLPSHPQALTSSAEPQSGLVTAALDAEALTQLLRSEVRSAVSAALHERAQGIQWRRVHSVAEVEEQIRQAHAAGKHALLDFTGPSCASCQLMAKTVFQDQRVIEAWNAQWPIEIDTDASDALAAWQAERFNTYARPLYVRVSQDGTEERWSQVFSASDAAQMNSFVAFLRGGVGADAGSGGGWGFIFLAIAGGLFTLVMPCTYPMIPLTINVFAKQAAGGRRLLPLALSYGAGIAGSFTVLGVVITAVFGSTLSVIAASPLLNVAVGLLFLLLGASLLGAFFLRLPAGIQGAFGGGRGGYVGALLMGLTFAITAFTCTAPFAGAVLAEGVRDGDVSRAVLGMLVYGATIAVPFVALALAPGLLRSLPRAGSWMDEFKHVGGLVEIAAALKFLAIADAAWGWGVIGRSFTLAIWGALALISAVYVAGWLRLPGDEPVPQVGFVRLLLVVGLLAAGLWLIGGLWGNHLGFLESFFPADPAPRR